MSDSKESGSYRSRCRFCGDVLDSDLGRDIGLCPVCDEEANP